LELAETALQEELEINPNNVLARYKLGALEVERGEGAKSKELIEGALQQDPSLKNSSYYLGRAEMELGNYSAAAESFERTVSSPGVEPELVQQAWYQLGTAYRHLHRIEDAQKAFANFQRLKDEQAQKLQERLKKKREAGNQNSVPPAAPQNP
jgi:tetratricopeptide (TPR) repeat protein